MYVCTYVQNVAYIQFDTMHAESDILFCRTEFSVVNRCVNMYAIDASHK